MAVERGVSGTYGVRSLASRDEQHGQTCEIRIKIFEIVIVGLGWTGGSTIDVTEKSTETLFPLGAKFQKSSV